MVEAVVGPPATVGITLRDLPGGLTARPLVALRQARAHGFFAVQFPSVSMISPTYDVDTLRDFGILAAEVGVETWFAIGMLHPHHLDRAEELIAAGDGDLVRGLERIVTAAVTIGVHELTVIIGKESDRFNCAPPWAEQLRDTAALLRRLAPVLRQAGCRLLIKTHEEITTFEVIRLIEEVGTDVVGVAFDPVNVMVRLEDPVSAAHRLEGYVETVHVDDAWICRTEHGLVRRLCPLGKGHIEWSSILSNAALMSKGRHPARLLIDFHRAELSMPYFDPVWLAEQPDVTVAELGLLERAAIEDRTSVTDASTRLDTAAEHIASWREDTKPKTLDEVCE